MTLVIALFLLYQGGYSWPWYLIVIAAAGIEENAKIKYREDTSRQIELLLTAVGRLDEQIQALRRSISK